MRNSKIPYSLLFIFIGFLVYPTLSLASECGEAIKPLSYYNNIAFYSLIVGFGLVLLGILSDVKIIKNTSFACAFIPFALWGYVHFIIDFSELKKNVFLGFQSHPIPGTPKTQFFLETNLENTNFFPARFARREMRQFGHRTFF